MNMSKVSPAALAVAGYLFTYWHTKAADGRKANIERVNDQLRDLYGPLLACITATMETYEAMIQDAPLEDEPSKSRKDAFREALAADPDGPVGKAYRYWMMHVLQPLNEQAADVIVKRIDLLQSDQMSPHLLKLVSHVAANRVVISRWKAGDVSAHSVIPYPDEVVGYVRRQFAKMKRIQAQLLGVRLTRSKL